MKPLASEFAEFVREVGIRAFDRLTERIKDQGASRRAVLRSWSKLSRDDKAQLMDELIASAQDGENADDVQETPTPKKAKSETKAPRIVKRFEPEEVEATLPKKIVKKKKGAKAASRRTGQRPT